MYNLKESFMQNYYNEEIWFIWKYENFKKKVIN